MRFHNVIRSYVTSPRDKITADTGRLMKSRGSLVCSDVEELTEESGYFYSGTSIGAIDAEVTLLSRLLEKLPAAEHYFWKAGG